MDVEIRIAECAAIVPMSGVLVWFDYLDHRYLRISTRGLELIGMFQEWRCLSEIMAGLEAEDGYGEVRSLIRANVLKVKGGARDLKEQRVLEEWGEDLVAARIFQFATRTTKTQEFVPLADAVAMMERQSAEKQRPGLCRAVSGPAYPLDNGSALGAFGNSSLVSALLRRRSVRAFDSKTAVSYAKFSSILQLGAGAQEVQETGSFDDYFKRTSASGGALQPVDIYCYARRVDGIAVGWYYFDSVRFELKRIADESAQADICAAAGDQQFFGSAAIVLVFAADVRREFWKYRSSRAYRVIMADFGHLAQTFALLAVEAGMASVVSCALRDEMIEAILGLDCTHDVSLGAMAIGLQEVGST